MKILKNTTNADIELRILGVTIDALSQRNVEVEDFLILASDDSINELTPYLNSGDVIVNNGIRDLSISEALIYLSYPIDASNSLFDNTSNGFVSKNVQDAIEESTTKTKRNISLTLIRNATTSDGWLNISDNGIPSNQTTWTPPFNCRLTSLGFSNKNDTEETKVSAHYKDFSTDNNIQTSDPTSWYIDSEDTLSIKGYDGRQWIYDNTNSTDYMDKDKRYGFRVTKISGSNMNDVQVTLIFQEI